MWLSSKPCALQQVLVPLVLDTKPRKTSLSHSWQSMAQDCLTPGSMAYSSQLCCALQLELMLGRQACAASLLSWASNGRGRALEVLMCGLAGDSLVNTMPAV